MKKIISLFPLLALVVFSMTSCLKDKGFEDQKYGINDPDNSRPGVGFKNGLAVKNPIGVNASADSQTFDFLVSYTGGTPPTSDVTVQVTIDNSVVAAYNANPLNADSIVAVPAGTVSLPATVTIPAGQRFANVTLTIPNATVFDPTLAYGVGLKITGVDQNAQVASNLQNLLVTISVKNQYDGKYTLVWSNYHPTSNPGYTGGTQPVEMITSGPNSVKLFWPLLDDYGNPAIISGALSYFGGQEPEYTINTATNQVTVQNVADGAVTFYTMNPTFNSRYDPLTKKIFAKWGYSYVNGQFVLGTSREWTQEFTYTGPR